MFRIDTPNKAVDLFGAGKHGFRDGDMALGINPTELSAAQQNAYQEELAGVIEYVGMALNKADNAQLLEAIKRLIDAQSGNYALDTGVADAYVVALDPAIVAYGDGMMVHVKAVNANTGASTLNAGGGVKSLVNDAGGALAADDIPAGCVFTATYIQSEDKFFINSLVQSQGDARYAKQEQIQSGALVNIAAALTGAEYAATPSPAITAYAAGQKFMATFDLACPAAPTLALNGIASPPSLVRQNLDGSYETLNVNDFPAGWKSPVLLVSTTQALVENLPRITKFLTGLTRDLAAASGNVAYTGCGATPKKVWLRGYKSGSSIVTNGAGTEGGNNCVGTNGVGLAASGAFVGVFAIDQTNYQSAVVQSFTKDTVTLGWVKALSPTGTVNFVLEVEY